jgi:hypothetical protein
MTPPPFRQATQTPNRTYKTMRWVLLNQLGVPGLGTIVMGQKIVGALQLALFLPGFVLFVLWFFRLMFYLYSLYDFDNPPVEPAALTRMLVAGVSLCAISWLWALITGLIALKRERAPAPRVPSTDPPSGT